MDFAALPPEINSGRMYAGPGSGPMLAVAAAWDGLAADLHATASSYSSVVSGLTSGPWLGPASAAMAAAAASYVAWLNATATQAEETATHAEAAVAAFEAAFAITVPPPVIAANRALLMALVATNFFGQNTPAIAATEANYGEMWAQDAVAMYGYAGASAVAARLTPFNPPAPTVVGPFSTLHQLIAAVPSTLHGLASAGTSSSSWASDLQIATLPALLARIATTPATYLASAAGGNNVGQRLGMMQAMQAVQSALGPEALAKLGGLGGIAGMRAGAASMPVSAGVGQASSIGVLSVPPSWAATAPPVRLVAAALAETNVGKAPSTAPRMPGGAFTQSLLGTLAGRAVGAAAAKQRASVVPRIPAAG